MRTLFQVDVGRTQRERALQYNADELGLDEADRAFAKSLVDGTLDNLSRIDSIIARHAQNWSISRMARTDRSILRMGAYEILFQTDVPGSVAVNEAVELAKAYGDADSGKFVNGILGHLLRQETTLRSES